jgi:hypothetical protein
MSTQLGPEFVGLMLLGKLFDFFLVFLLVGLVNLFAECGDLAIFLRLDLVAANCLDDMLRIHLGRLRRILGVRAPRHGGNCNSGNNRLQAHEKLLGGGLDSS